jgi:hypothetical protein
MTEEALKAIPEEHLEWVTDTARMCHEVERSYCEAIREDCKPWSELSDTEKSHIVGKVAFRIIYPDAKASAFHESWMISLMSKGWKYGKEVSQDNKTHPNLKPFHHLPTEQQAKDHIFMAIVQQTSIIQ